jgi:hypothetical protein
MEWHVLSMENESNLRAEKGRQHVEHMFCWLGGSPQLSDRLTKAVIDKLVF